MCLGNLVNRVQDSLGVVMDLLCPLGVRQCLQLGKVDVLGFKLVQSQIRRGARLRLVGCHR